MIAEGEAARTVVGSGPGSCGPCATPGPASGTPVVSTTDPGDNGRGDDPGRASTAEGAGVAGAVAAALGERTRSLSPLDRAMLRLYLAASAHRWRALPALARAFLAEGASDAALRATVRHVIVLGGYGPCLKAMLTLKKAGVLGGEPSPGKVRGPPGNAFELVYGPVTDRVRASMHGADPVLGEWIRSHLYGDVYSSPGLELRQKQLLTCAYLSTADMPDQLFGHAIAALRFGLSLADLLEAAEEAAAATVEPACPGGEVGDDGGPGRDADEGPGSRGRGRDIPPAVDPDVRRTLRLAAEKVARGRRDGTMDFTPPSVAFNAEGDVLVPDLPPLWDGSEGERSARHPPEPPPERHRRLPPEPCREPPSASGGAATSAAAPEFSWEALGPGAPGGEDDCRHRAP